ncbi:hypothetical protein [Methylobrevis pamukkalensis]|uniref:Capsule polysaccharide biosynthesis protein n=1 Tax=Methylobrevis pamukkalensis TaxID=1439726 RepID=A0A1E3H0B5_9HYPH|nr:hypothetical protein [Methylobrevis pamukkalensis]ODN69732.1 Capsule polysaccharide biosynthesis protein [Methylobrevis pamukkalensis]
MFLSPFFYPHYRWHAIYHPLKEYAGWLRKFAVSRWEKKRVDKALEELKASQAPFFFFPLQLATDYQIRKHSPYANLETAVERVINSFAHHAPKNRATGH